MMSEMLVNMVSGNGLLPVRRHALPLLMFTNYALDPQELSSGKLNENVTISIQENVYE